MLFAERRTADIAMKSSLYGPPRLTYLSEQAPGAASEAEAEADLLPFAIDRESSLSSPMHPPQEDMHLAALSELDTSLSTGRGH